MHISRHWNSGATISAIYYMTSSPISRIIRDDHIFRSGGTASLADAPTYKSCVKPKSRTAAPTETRL